MGKVHGRGRTTLGHLNPVHTIHNALICVIALHAGWDQNGFDSRLAPTIAVMCGLDTDCNGATVGSIVGAAVGRVAFNADYAAPLRDRVEVHMIGFQACTMQELAARHFAVYKWLMQIFKEYE